GTRAAHTERAGGVVLHVEVRLAVELAVPRSAERCRETQPARDAEQHARAVAEAELRALAARGDHFPHWSRRLVPELPDRRARDKHDRRCDSAPPEHWPPLRPSPVNDAHLAPAFEHPSRTRLPHLSGASGPHR